MSGEQLSKWGSAIVEPKSASELLRPRPRTSAQSLKTVGLVSFRQGWRALVHFGMVFYDPSPTVEQIEALDQKGPVELDLVILDDEGLMQPIYDAVLEVRKRWPAASIIVTGERMDLRDCLWAYGAGATAYVIPSHPNAIPSFVFERDLLPALTNFVKRTWAEAVIYEDDYRQATGASKTTLTRVERDEVNRLHEEALGLSGVPARDIPDELISGINLKVAAWARQRRPTEKQIRILAHLAMGLDQNEAAKAEGISRRAVEGHLSKLKARWTCSSTHQLIVCAWTWKYFGRAQNDFEQEKGSYLSVG